MKEILIEYSPSGKIEFIDRYLYVTFNMKIGEYDFGESGELSIYRTKNPNTSKEEAIADFVKSNGIGYNIFVDSDESDAILLEIYVNKLKLVDTSGNPVPESELMDLIYTSDIKDKFKMASDLLSGKTYQEIREIPINKWK